MAAIVTLGLDPEYGGTVFGPFQSTTVVLGSEPSQCTITLHEGMGVRSTHAQLIVQPDGVCVLQPTDIAGPVYIFGPKGPERLRGAARLGQGESFALVAADGVRFTIGVQHQTVTATPASARPIGAGRLSAPALVAEAKRQLDATAQTVGPVATARKAGYQAKSGALFNPQKVVGVLFILGFMAVISCGGMVGLGGLAGFLKRFIR